MDKIVSDLPPKAYMQIMKSKLESPFMLFSDRTTGVVIGRFFSVAFYSPWEWNCRITGECNRAMGYVKQKNGKTEVRFIRSKGLLSPFWIIFFFLMGFIMMSLMLLEDQGAIDYQFCAISGLVAVLFGCGISAWQSCLTEAGDDGACEITSLLQAPDQYY